MYSGILFRRPPQNQTLALPFLLLSLRNIYAANAMKRPTEVTMFKWYH